MQYISCSLAIPPPNKYQLIMFKFTLRFIETSEGCQTTKALNSDADPNFMDPLHVFFLGGRGEQRYALFVFFSIILVDRLRVIVCV